MSIRPWRTMALACTLLLALLCLAGAPAAASSVAAAESAAVRAHEQWLSALDAQLQAEMTLEAASAAEAAADAQLELSDEMEEADADAEESPRGTAGLSQAQEEEMAAMIEPAAAAETQLAEVASASTSSVRAFRNGPLVPPAPSPRGSKLTFKRTLPSRLKFKRMVSEAKDKLHDNRALTETSASTHTTAHAGTKAKAKSSVRSRARAHSRSRSRSRAGSDAPDGGEGDWTTAPSWWTPPGEENTRPWKEDDYSYMVRPRDPNSYINPSAAASFAAGRAVHPLLHRALAGAPASVFAHQSPAVPPLPELDANMQPTNNYPNPPFYEHNYNKEYIWG